MKVIKKEEHQVTRSFTFDIPNEDIIKVFGSVERFQEIISHNMFNDWIHEPFGEEPTDEESDMFYDFFADYSYDMQDDWWSERKNSYQTTYELDNN